MVRIFYARNAKVKPRNQPTFERFTSEDPIGLAGSGPISVRMLVINPSASLIPFGLFGLDKRGVNPNQGSHRGFLRTSGLNSTRVEPLVPISRILGLRISDKHQARQTLDIGLLPQYIPLTAAIGIIEAITGIAGGHYDQRTGNLNRVTRRSATYLALAAVRRLKKAWTCNDLSMPVG